MAEEPKPKEAVKSGKEKGKKVEDTSTTIHVKVYSPFQVYFDGEATSISAENDTGPFDVLARHHRFITLLNPCELDIRASSGDKKIKISQGVMHVRDNKVTVFLDV
jgi:F0F1-type ATP synthase epsilon subunit